MLETSSRPPPPARGLGRDVARSRARGARPRPGGVLGVRARRARASRRRSRGQGDAPRRGVRESRRARARRRQDARRVRQARGRRPDRGGRGRARRRARGPGGSDAPSRPRLASAAPDVGGRRPVPSSVVPTAPRRSPPPRRARDVPFDPAKDDAATYALRRDLAALDHEETLARLTTARAETLAVRLVRFRPAPAVGVDRAKPRPDDDAGGRAHRPPLTIRRRVSSCVDPNAKPVHFLVRRAVRAQNESLAPDPRAETRDEDALAAMLPDVREKMQLHSAVRCLYRLAAADSDDSDASSDEDEPEIENAAPPKEGPSFAALEEAAVRGSSSYSKSPGGGGGAPQKNNSRRRRWTRACARIRDVRPGDVLAVRCACDDPPPGRASSDARRRRESGAPRDAREARQAQRRRRGRRRDRARAADHRRAATFKFFSDGTREGTPPGGTRATRPVSAPPAFVDVGSDATDQIRPPRKEGGAFVGSDASSLAPRPLLVRIPPAYKTPESALAAVSRAVLAARRSHSPAIALYDETLAPVVDFDAQIRDAGGVVFYRCAHHPAPAPAGAGRRQRAADEKLSAVKEGKERSFAVVAVRRERNGAKAVVRRRETIHVPDRPGLLSMSLSALRRRARSRTTRTSDMRVVSMRVGGRELEHPAQLEPGAKLFWSAEKRSAVKNARSEGDHFREGNDEPREKKRPGRRPASAGSRNKTRNAFAEEVFSSETFSSGVKFSSGIGVGAPPSSLSPPSSPAAEARARGARARRRSAGARRPAPADDETALRARPEAGAPAQTDAAPGDRRGRVRERRALRREGAAKRRGRRRARRRAPGGEKAKKRKGAVGARKARRAIEIDPIDRGGGGRSSRGMRRGRVSVRTLGRRFPPTRWRSWTSRPRSAARGARRARARAVGRGALARARGSRGRRAPSRRGRRVDEGGSGGA